MNGIQFRCFYGRIKLHSCPCNIVVIRTHLLQCCVCVLPFINFIFLHQSFCSFRMNNMFSSFFLFLFFFVQLLHKIIIITRINESLNHAKNKTISRELFKCIQVFTVFTFIMLIISLRQSLCLPLSLSLFPFSLSLSHTTIYLFSISFQI